ncbi:YlbF family regulator [Anaerovorax odorimutans]|uniref:YlbF family regulator n=1 Tax=Anaerovorax odorimutans TaxID=109327 RepID=A0ABT1RL59_9FIRM|nr:YlbF family regulator [Anaerovorax odorimutans]MCQ4635903.1 YlbF family regulator [Anaerovorax odorimutans]
MNVYDEAHKLTQAIRESEEYKQYQAAKEKIKGNTQLEQTLKDFKAKQISAQAKQMMEGQLDQEAMTQIQQLSMVLMQDPLAAEYLQCEIRFSMMINDVYQILSEVIDLGMGGALSGQQND